MRSFAIYFLAALTAFLHLVPLHAQKTAGNECFEPTIRVIESSSQGITFQVNIPCMNFSQVETPNGNFQRVNMNSRFLLHGDGNFGKPEIAAYTTHIAFPVGSTPASINIKPNGQAQTRKNIRLYPVQREESTPTGQERKPKFEFVQETYNSFKNNLREPTNVRPAMQQNVNIYKFAFDMVRYLPQERTLQWYNSYTIEIKYKDPSDCFQLVPMKSDKFRTDRIDRLNLRKRTLAYPGVINIEDLKKVPCPGTFKPIVFGCDLLIITDPDFEGPSDDLEIHKEARGVRTVVVNTQTISDKYGDGSGNVTDEEIKEYIKWYYDAALIKPRWLLLMGDAEFIPTHYNMDIVLSKSIAAGDQYYGQLNDDDLEIPAMGIGRFPVDTEDQAQAIVDKVKDYENNPPWSFSSYYYNYTFAAQFQDNDNDSYADREYIETAEFIRDHLLTQNIDVERAYKNKSSTQAQYYDDGAAIPAELSDPSFNWDADATEVVDGINDGRLIVFHRDHGSKNGWGSPDFKVDDIDDIVISNNMWPLIFSINCTSGIFDNETCNDPSVIVNGGLSVSTGGVYFSEKFLRERDGAIALMCDTRASSTSMNNKMSKGLFDAYFPGLESYGGTTKIEALGDVLNHAKGYVDANSTNDYAIEKENTIYNLLGDPSMVVPAGFRYRFILKEILILNTNYPLIEVELDWDNVKDELPPLPQMINRPINLPIVLQNPKTGEVLGRALTDKDGKAKVRVPKNYKGSIQATVSANGLPTVTKSIR